MAILERIHYIIECRHVSGASEWGIEPDCSEIDTRAEAEEIMRALERTDEDGAPLEYRIVEATRLVVWKP
jgi:hypothetical protein